nr:MAG TPA: hypothetical protein [Caudoviricetes sp.]
MKHPNGGKQFPPVFICVSPCTCYSVQGYFFQPFYRL